ncbi:hypothetical protein KCU73_g17164, partial [Aureobasidium melanogenum]
MWTQSGSDSRFDWVNISIPDASKWDAAADPLMLEGSGFLGTDRINFGPASLDGVAVSMTSNFTVTESQPNTSYTLDVGMLSLDTGLDTVNWTTGNGSDVSYYRFLYRAYQTKNIPSVSFGLHIPVHQHTDRFGHERLLARRAKPRSCVWRLAFSEHLEERP